MILIGIDPGASGGIAVAKYVYHSKRVEGKGYTINETPVWVKAFAIPSSETQLWDIVSNRYKHYPKNADEDVYVVLEQQTPRPTRFFRNGKWESSILKSTCVLYGQYMQIRGMLVASESYFREVTPQVWQAKLGLTKDKSDSTPWKTILKRKAEALFPSIKVTLKTSDALLLVRYGLTILNKD